MDIRDVIEEKYTNYLNYETDNLDLTIEEAKFILANDEKVHFVDDLLVEAYKVVLSELEKKDKIIDLMAEQLAGLAIFDIDKDESLILRDKEEIKQYFKEKVENEN